MNFCNIKQFVTNYLVENNQKSFKGIFLCYKKVGKLIFPTNVITFYLLFFKNSL